jgi:hypothetical protein
MVGESIGDIPANCRADRHGNTFFPSDVPSGYGNRDEVEYEKTEFISSDVVKPTQRKQDDYTNEYNG